MHGRETSCAHLHERVVRQVMSNTNANRPIAVGSDGVIDTPPRKPSRLAAKKAAMKTRQRPDERSSAEIQKNLNRHKLERAVFWTCHIGLGLFLGLSALVGLLVRPESQYWQSLIWLVPLLVALVPIGVSLFRFRRYGLAQVGSRAVISLLVGLLLFVGFFVLIESGLSDFIFAFFAGNETIGYLNIWRAIGSWFAGLGFVGGIIGGILVAVGWVLTVIAVFILPPILLIDLIEGLIQDPRLSIGALLARSGLVIGVFVMPIGQSIVTNSGM